MEPINWFMNVVTQHYFDFRGRARRAEFWWYALVYTILYAALHLIGSIVHVGSLLSFAFWLALLLPSLSVAARRLHDTGRNGWLVLIALVPATCWNIMTYGAGATGAVFGAHMPPGIFGWITLVAAVVMVYFFVQPGAKGDNSYGSDPKAGLA